MLFSSFSEHIQFADGSSIFNNLGIVTISCHTRHVLVVAVLWHIGDCIDTVCDVDAIAEQIRTDRHKGGKFESAIALATFDVFIEQTILNPISFDTYRI